MSMVSKIKNHLAERKAKKERRAAMSFNSTSGGGSAKHVRPEPPGSRHTGSDQSFGG